jgi:hypothetical protein
MTYFQYPKKWAAATLATLALTTVSYGQTPQSTQRSAASSRSQTAVPVTMTECEGPNRCATWTFLGSQGNGQWPTGEVANLIVENFNADTVAIRRADSTGLAVGLTALYKGTRHGDRIDGQFTSSWPGHWNSQTGDWYATIEKTTQGPPPVLRECLVPEYKWCWTYTWNNGHYDGVSDRGNTATMTVISFSRDAVAWRHTSSPGYVAEMTGKISGQGDHILNGDWWDNNGSSGHFIATWGAALRDLPASRASVQPTTPPARPVICYPWFFTIVCQ